MKESKKTDAKVKICLNNNKTAKTFRFQTNSFAGIRRAARRFALKVEIGHYLYASETSGNQIVLRFPLRRVKLPCGVKENKCE